MPSLLSKLLGPRAETTIALPGRRGKPTEEGGEGATVTLWELGSDECTDATMDALDWLAKKYKMERADVRGLIAPVDVDHEIKVQQLFRAMRNPENTKEPFALAPVEVRALPPYDVQWLYERFLDHQAANSEYLTLKLDELQKMVFEDLGKAETPEDFWRRCDSVTLRSLGRALETRCGTLTRQLSETMKSLHATEAGDSTQGSSTDSSPSSAPSP